MVPSEAWRAVIDTFPTAHAEDRRRVLGLERNPLHAAAPKMLGAAQQLFHFECFILTDADLVQRNLDVAFARLEGIEADHDQYAVAEVFGALAIEQHVVVSRGIETQVVQLVKGGIVAADRIYARYILLDVSRTVPVPHLELVFLGAVVLLLIRYGAVLAQFIAAIDPVEAAQGG